MSTLCPDLFEMAARHLSKSRTFARIALREGDTPKGRHAQQEAEVYGRIAERLATEADRVRGLGR